MNDLTDFLEPVNLAMLNNDESYNNDQLANNIQTYQDQFPEISETDIIIAGINEQRGAGFLDGEHAADAVRKQLYGLHYWHAEVKITDIGNIKAGATLQDSYAAIKIVLSELLKLNKVVMLIGGSHDLTLAQYFSYKEAEQLIEATVIDAKIDLQNKSSLPEENFLMEMLTGEPNNVNHYNHIGFQSYFVHPRMLETLDKLRFDCYRLGVVKEQIEEMEPVIRNTNMLSFDISAIRHSDFPANAISPNGLSGEDACKLCRYAGMSASLNTFGIYGYRVENDFKNLSALQIAQMIWYFIDGKSRNKQEALFDDKHNFNEYHTAFAEIDTVFFQSKKTGRWWMQLPDKNIIACSYTDYLNASNNEIPERWLRQQERI